MISKPPTASERLANRSRQKSSKTVEGSAQRNQSAASNIERRLREAELLLDVAHRMAGYETLDDVLNALVEMTSEELGTERGSLFLHDPATNELYSRVAQGNLHREIRILNTSGIAGHAYSNEEALIIHDAYSDPRFNSIVDEQLSLIHI